MWCVRVGVGRFVALIFIGSVVCCRNYSGWFVLVSGIDGAEWVFMGVVLLWRFGLAVAWGFVKYVIIVDVDARVVDVVSRLRMVMIVDGGVC